jgi:uncharacterized protein
MTTHTSHANIVKRLKRAEGHLRSIITMFEKGKGCLEIAQQLQAVEHAVSNAKKTLVHDHIDHCIDLQANADLSSAKKTLKELKEISKYL